MESDIPSFLSKFLVLILIIPRNVNVLRRKEMIIFCLLRWFVDVMVWRWGWRYKYFIREKPTSQTRIFFPLIFVIWVYPGDELSCFEGKLAQHNADDWDDNLFSKERKHNSIRMPASVSDAFPFNISINYTFPYSCYKRR